MIVSSTVRTAIRSIFHTPVRSALTMVGVVIGIAAVISLVGLGRGLQQQVAAGINDLGATRMTVSSVDPQRATAQRGQGGRANFGGQGAPSLTSADYASIAGLPGVKVATPDEQAQIDVANAASADTATAYELRGVDVGWLSTTKAVVGSGRFFTADQIANKSDVVMLGEQAARDLFGATDPIGKTLMVGATRVSVIGVLDSDGDQNPRSSVDGQIVAPWTSWLTITGTDNLSSLVVFATNVDAVAQLQEAMTDVLLSRHGIVAGANPDVAITSSADLLQTRSDVAAGFSSTLVGIAAVARSWAESAS